jgi:hypothetical protein
LRPKTRTLKPKYREGTVNIKETLLYLANNFAGTLSAIIALAGVIAAIKPVGNSLKRFFFAELYRANDSQDRRLDNLEMQQLKQIICDRRLPDGDRLNAGDEYVRRGGNGEIKMVHEALKAYCEKKRIEDRERAEAEQAAMRREA